MERSWRWNDAHFCKLPSQTDYLYGIATTPQTNVYGHAKVIDPLGSNKLLIASLAGKITALEYQRVFDKLTPSAKGINFTYIPGGSELVSIDVINKSATNGLTVGVTFIKLQDEEEGGHTHMQYLNVYSSNQLEEATLESVAQECINIGRQLNFVPYQLTHTFQEFFNNNEVDSLLIVEETGVWRKPVGYEPRLISGSKNEQVFLLSGSDNKVHMYREVSLSDTNEHTFIEEASESHFPEFQNLESCVQWMDIIYFDDNKQRLTATGHQDGLVQVHLIDVTNTEVLQSWSIELDSPITCIRLFTTNNKVPCPSFVNKENINIESTETSDPVYHLLVLGALEPATVYRDILRNDLKDSFILPESDKYDVPLCACIVDVDFDGQNEILIGTYGQELLAYKFVERDFAGSRSNSMEKAEEEIQSILKSETNLADLAEKHRHKSNETETSSDNVKDTPITRRVKSQENLSSSLKNSPQTEITKTLKNSPQTEVDNVMDSNTENTQPCSYVGIKQNYKLLWQRSFPCPIMGVDRVDIMGDGMDDLVVVTLRGMHVIQPDLQEVAKVCLERLKDLTVTDEENKT